MKRVLGRVKSLTLSPKWLENVESFHFLEGSMKVRRNGPWQSQVKQASFEGGVTITLYVNNLPLNLLGSVTNQHANIGEFHFP